MSQKHIFHTHEFFFLFQGMNSEKAVLKFSSYDGDSTGKPTFFKGLYKFSTSKDILWINYMS